MSDIPTPPPAPAGEQLHSHMTPVGGKTVAEPAVSALQDHYPGACPREPSCTRREGVVSNPDSEAAGETSGT